MNGRTDDADLGGWERIEENKKSKAEKLDLSFCELKKLPKETEALVR